MSPSLFTQELVARMDAEWKEDRWLLSQLLDEMTGPAAPKRLTKNEQRLAEVLAAPRGKLHPTSILLGGDYSVRRRLGGRLKEVQWMGESFAVKHIIGDGEAVGAEVALLSSVAHPNVAHAAHCFHDEDRKEYFVVMDQLMAKDLGSYVKEVSCPRRRTPFPLVVAVDIMLQIARGMEYLHAKGICHGELNPSNVIVKPRQPDGGYVQVKVTEFLLQRHALGDVLHRRDGLQARGGLLLQQRHAVGGYVQYGAKASAVAAAGPRSTSVEHLAGSGRAAVGRGKEGEEVPASAAGAASAAASAAAWVRRAASGFVCFVCFVCFV